MSGNIIFLQQRGDFATTTKELYVNQLLDVDQIEELLEDVEFEILESPRKAIMHRDTFRPIIAYPISALVKRGLKAALNYDHFNNKKAYDEFIDAVNSRYNDYVVLNKYNLE